MAKKLSLFLVLLLAFLCLVSCSSLIEDYLWQTGVFAPVTTSTIKPPVPTVTGEPISVTTSKDSVTGGVPTAVSALAPVTTAAQKGVTVMLDAGHGENDPGAVGVLDGVQYWEKHINLSVAQKLKSELVARGYTVLMIRDGDTSLLHGWDTQGEAVARRNLGASSLSDVYVSLHCNSYAGAGRAWGPIVFYNGNGRYSPKKLVAILQSSISGAFAEYENMRQCRIVDDEGYIVLQNRSMPSFLIEMGFLTDESDLKMLLDEEWQNEMVRAVADGIDEMYKKDYIG